MAYVLRSRLRRSVNDVFQRCQHSKRYPCNIELQSRCFASREEIADEETQGAAKFTTSRANSETARDARERNTKDDSPWSQTISLGFSLAAFLLYFGIFREPNDLDEDIHRDISDRVPALKEVQKKLQTSAGKVAGGNSM